MRAEAPLSIDKHIEGPISMQEDRLGWKFIEDESISGDFLVSTAHFFQSNHSPLGIVFYPNTSTPCEILITGNTELCNFTFFGTRTPGGPDICKRSRFREDGRIILGAVVEVPSSTHIFALYIQAVWTTREGERITVVFKSPDFVCLPGLPEAGAVPINFSGAWVGGTVVYTDTITDMGE